MQHVMTRLGGWLWVLLVLSLSANVFGITFWMLRGQSDQQSVLVNLTPQTLLEAVSQQLPPQSAERLRAQFNVNSAEMQAAEEAVRLNRQRAIDALRQPQVDEEELRTAAQAVLESRRLAQNEFVAAFVDVLARLPEEERRVLVERYSPEAAGN